MSTDPRRSIEWNLKCSPEGFNSRARFVSLNSLLSEFVERLQGVDALLDRGGSTREALSKLIAAANGLSSEFSFELDRSAGNALSRGPRSYGAFRVHGSPPDGVLRLFQREATNLLERGERETRQAAGLKRLSKAGRIVGSSLDLPSTLRAILEMALEVTGAGYGIFRLLDAGGARLETAAVVGENLDAPLVEALEVEGLHVTGWVARRRQSLRIDDLTVPPWSETYFPLDRGLEMKSELAVPLLGVGGRLEGVLNLESPVLAAFSVNDQLLLETFAGHAVMAIQQARLLDALQEIAEGVLEWPCDRVLERLVELSGVLLNPRGVELEHSRGVLRVGSPTGSKLSVEIEAEGSLSAYLDEPSEWEQKVLSCLARHAGLALRNQRRLEELVASQQRQALTEAFAAVGDLSANLLHQLNNKVGVIPVRVEGILDKCSGEVESSPYLHRNLQEIGQSAQRALEIVRQNLSILKPRESGLVKLENCWRRAIKELSLEDKVEGRLDVPEVRGDVRSLTLVFFNLLENASRVIGKSGRVLGAGRVEGERIVVKVSDNGPGIPQDRQREIFHLNSDRTKPHNLGFGLWWVRTVLERTGGAISVESDGCTGTTFVLEFPLP